MWSFVHRPEPAPGRRGGEFRPVFRGFLAGVDHRRGSSRPERRAGPPGVPGEDPRGSNAARAELADVRARPHRRDLRDAPRPAREAAGGGHGSRSRGGYGIWLFFSVDSRQRQRTGEGPHSRQGPAADAVASVDRPIGRSALPEPMDRTERHGPLRAERDVLPRADGRGGHHARLVGPANGGRGAATPVRGALPGRDLVGAEVRLRGVYGAIFSAQGRFLGMRLWLSSFEDIEVERQEIDEPFDKPLRTSGRCSGSMRGSRPWNESTWRGW